MSDHAQRVRCTTSPTWAVCSPYRQSRRSARRTPQASWRTSSPTTRPPAATSLCRDRCSHLRRATVSRQVGRRARLAQHAAVATCALTCYAAGSATYPRGSTVALAAAYTAPSHGAHVASCQHTSFLGIRADPGAPRGPALLLQLLPHPLAPGRVLLVSALDPPSSCTVSSLQIVLENTGCAVLCAASEAPALRRTTHQPPRLSRCLLWEQPCWPHAHSYQLDQADLS